MAEAINALFNTELIRARAQWRIVINVIGPREDSRELRRTGRNVPSERLISHRPAQTPHIQSGFFIILWFGGFENMPLTSAFVAGAGLEPATPRL